jgi:hypothetical protein
MIINLYFKSNSNWTHWACLTQNCTDDPGILIIGVRITEGTVFCLKLNMVLRETVDFMFTILLKGAWGSVVVTALRY